MASPLVLTSSEVVDVDAPPDAPDPRVTELHIVAVSVPSTPTLVDGVPQ